MSENRTPELVLGTMYYGTRIDPDRAFALMDRFIEAGGSWLDTADCYSFWTDSSGVGGASERVIGQWLRARPGIRDAVRIATKVRQNPLVPHQWPQSAEGLSAEAVFAGLAGSLNRLGVDSVDLLWAHAEDRTVDLAETVRAFGELVSEGRAGRIGAANHPSWRVEQARALARADQGAPWSALQLRHSLLQPRPHTALPDAGHRHLVADDLDYAGHEGLDVWAYTTLLNGGYARVDRPLPDIYRHPGTTEVLRVLDDVASETGATRNQIVLAWLMREGVHPIVGVSTLEQLDEAIDATQITLQDEHMERFAAAR